MTTTQPHTLTYVQPLFLEQQRAREVYPRASIVVTICALTPIVAMAIVTFVAGQRILWALLPGMVIVTFVVATMAILMRFANATTVVETTLVQLRLSIGSWRVWHRNISVDQIRRVDLTNTTGQLSVLKNGVGEQFFMTRKTSVRLHLPEYNYVLIGTNTPEELRDAIRSAIATSTATTPAPAGSV